jgi:hypothetical protein
VKTSDGIASIWRTALYSLCLSLVLAGCSPEGEKKAEDKAEKKPTRALRFEAPPVKKVEVSGLTAEQQAALVSRVEEKWRAMERRDFAAVYEYTTPNYRKIFTKPMFLNKFGPSIRWELTGVDLLHYDADAAVASVGVRVMTGRATETSQASGGIVADTVQEQWLLIDGEWWNNAK